MALNKIQTYHGSMFRCLQEVISQRCLLAVSSIHTTSPQSNSNSCSVVRCSRQKYERMYPVLLVRPDGSTINIRYKEPRRIIMMPVDISSLSEEERKARIRKRDPKRGVVKRNDDEFEDDFKLEDYSKFWKKT
ncbi:39S ribosomal protein L55, mitochondrial [Ictalurus punctatus]|uniref:39S ribosomal protein L55, mitochondrial n=1 Tax=Ictalurus punctatus TaxID=7998 RepID=A0A2D0QYE5_ICTPU|nr:39S ribosomal protein L55, mitochondrial [Ictalurus punctatus]XP_053536332.1 39S ribosomal protein L55, mitochondrial [Ictalurus punctatus]